MSYSILVTGANGQLGQELQLLGPQFPEFKFIFTDRDTLDITEVEAIEELFQENSIQVCINCAAYTAVDRAEAEQETAQLINEKAVGNLARVCKKNQAPLFHISSDYVYHNQQNRPLLETDLCQAAGVYAQTKLAGEKLALAIHKETLVIRTSWVYSSFGHNFVKTMLRLGSERDQLSVVYDQVGAPTYAKDLAKAILSIIAEGKRDKWTGVYNFANAGVTSWYDFALAIFDFRQIDCEVLPILSEAYPTPAPRPNFSLLDTTKIQNTFSVETPYWRHSLEKCLKLIP